MGMIMGAMVRSTVLGVPIGAFLSEVGNWQCTFSREGYNYEKSNWHIKWEGKRRYTL